MDKLHPGARWMFRFNSLIFTIPMAFFLVYIGNAIIAAIRLIGASGVEKIEFSFGFLVICVLAFFVFVFVFAEVYSRLTYNNWKYKFEESALKLERGIIWKKYSNIPYERVQNVDVTRGILARMIGFSTINIQTAGAAYSGRGMPKSEGYIPAVGVNYAEEIRDFLMHKISKKSGGL